MDALTTAIESFLETCDHSRLKVLEEIGASKYFCEEMLDIIYNSIEENTMTPAVVHQMVAALVEERNSYIQKLSATSEILESLNVRADALEPGEAEIGFLIPRNLFENELGGLILELREIRRIIRTFSEVSGNAGESITVKQISTTDPMFFFGLDAKTIVTLGAVVTWALHTWKKVEEIRNIRKQTQSIPSFEEKEINEFFGNKVRNEIDKSINEKVVEILGHPGKAGRDIEIRDHLVSALKSIFARVERGMTVEIRLLPPPNSPLTKSVLADSI